MSSMPTSRFREGFAFLGFVLTSRPVTMRPKAVEKFKTKIQELTPRNHNLDQQVVKRVNAVVRGTRQHLARLGFVFWSDGWDSPAVATC